METVRLPRLTVDRQAIELATVFAVVLGVTAWLALQVQPETAASVSPPSTFGDGAQGEATAGVAWALAEVAFAGAILVALFVYKRLPGWLQETVKVNVVGGLTLFVGARYGAGAPVQTVAVFVGVYTGYRLLDHYGVYWLANNALAAVLAVVFGLAIGLLFGVAGMALGMIGLTVYDHVFANKRRWMFTLGQGIVRARLPVLFLRPSGWRLTWSEVVDMLGDAGEDGDADEQDDDGSWALGTADMMIPAGFVAAVVTAPADALFLGGALAATASIAGILVACFRLRFEMLSKGSGAGLPALSVGALVPYAIVFVSMGLV